MLSFASVNDASHAQLPSRTTALTISAVMIAANTPAKSSASSDSTRANRRSVSIRSRKDSAGGRLRRMSTAGRTTRGGAGVRTGSGLTRVSGMVTPLPSTRQPFTGSGVSRSKGCNRARPRGPGSLGRARPGERLYAGLLQRPAQALAELDRRLPAEDLAREGDVGPAHLRVVRRQRLVDDLRPRPGDVDHRVRQLEQRELVGVADVDRIVEAGLRQPDDPVDQVGDEADDRVCDPSPN